MRSFLRRLTGRTIFAVDKDGNRLWDVYSADTDEVKRVLKALFWTAGVQKSMPFTSFEDMEKAEEFLNGDFLAAEVYVSLFGWTRWRPTVR